MSVAVQARTEPYKKRWAALAVILGAEAMDLLDTSIVAGYSLAMAVGLIIGGRLGDVFGRKRMFLVGVLGFVLTSLLCAAAPSEGALIASRVLQGLFGAVMLPQGFGMIKEMFPPKELVKALAMFGPVMGVSAVCGPILAGLLIDLGLVVTGIGLITLFTLFPEPADSVWRLVPGVLIVGLGMGAMIAPLFDFILACVDDHEVGSASGVLNAVQRLGSAIGVAVLGTLFIAGSFGTAVIAMGVASALTFGLVFLLPSRARRESP